MSKNKTIRILATSALLAVALGGFSACAGDNEHVHDYTKWAHDDTQHWKVCEVDGAESTHVNHFFNAEDDYKCECGAQHTHVYEWKHNAEYHWQECADGFKTRNEQHSFDENGVCVCGETMAMTEVHGELKIYKNGTLETDYAGVTFTLNEIESGNTVAIRSTLNTDGTYSFKIPENETAYTLTISKDGYVSDSIAFSATNGELRDAKLVYIAYTPTPGMENWGIIDYSKLDDNIIGLNNDMQFIFTKDTYKKVAFSVTLQSDWNSLANNGRQGVIFRFKNGDNYEGIAAVQTLYDTCLRFDDEHYNLWGWNDSQIAGPLTQAEGFGGDWLVDFATHTNLKDMLNAGTLKLTVLRDGSVFYVYLNDELVGFKKFADKYADMECEAGFYYFNFAGSTMRDWHIELIEDTSALEAKIPSGSLNAAIKIKDTDTVTALADGENVRIERIDRSVISGEFPVTDGKIAFTSLMAGAYRFTYGDDYYAVIKIEEGAEFTDDVVLQHKRFDLFMGWGEGDHDFSHVNDENPTIGNDGGTLNVISCKAYNDVATSIWLKKENSVNGENTQGIVIKFSNGCYMVARCQLYQGVYKLQYMAELWGLPFAKAQWLDFQAPLTDAQMTAFDGDEGLKLTLVRTGNVLTIYVNGEKIPGGTVVLDEAYTSMTAQVGFFDWDSKANATWKFDIESDVSAYDTSFVKLGSEAVQYDNGVNLTGDVWQATKVKVDAGYTDEVRISFKAIYGESDYAVSILYQNGAWKLQEMNSWNETALSEEFVNALTGDGLYIAYCRNIESGDIKLYAGATKAALETAIANDTVAANFNWGHLADIHKSAIVCVGVRFEGGSYTASASGYAYGSTSADALKYLV